MPSSILAAAIRDGWFLTSSGVARELGQARFARPRATRAECDAFLLSIMMPSAVQSVVPRGPEVPPQYLGLRGVATSPGHLRGGFF